MPTVYIETSVISYLVADPSEDAIVAGNQEVTRRWWATKDRFDLVASQLVVQEAGAGDPDQAARRLATLESIRLLDISDAAEQVAAVLINEGPVPPKAAEDALHIALAAVNGVNFLTTWNCRHIANAAMRPRIEQVLRAAGYEPPTICTPQELLDA